MSDNNRKNDKTTAQKLLAIHKIDLPQLAMKSGVEKSSVWKALDIHRYQRVGYVRVKKTRAAAEYLLKAMGWDGEPADLWAEYDKPEYFEDAA